MQYTASLEREGKRTTIEFPDCPGCATFAEANEDATAVAKEALEGWLEAHLIEGDVPPRPSALASHPREATPILARCCENVPAFWRVPRSQFEALIEASL